MSTPTDKTLQTAFEQYYQRRVSQAGAHAPGLEQALLDKLEQEAQAGKIPLPDGNLVIVQDRAVVEAICNGQEVAIGGDRIRSPRTPAGKLPQVAQWPVAAKVGLIVACFLVPLLLFGAFLLMGSEAEGAGAAAQPAMSTEMAPSTQATPLAGTPTPAPLSLTHDRAPSGPQDPASIELAGFSYILSLGKVQGGTWQPDGAEWLAGTEVRRVVALPWEADTAPVLASLPPGTVIQLRLRSGEVVRYELVEVTRLARQQIEVLAQHTPSLVIVLHSEPESDERTVLLAQAVQATDVPSIQVETLSQEPLAPIP